MQPHEIKGVQAYTDRVQARIKLLEDHIKEYSDHDDRCGINRQAVGAPCTCGHDEAYKALEIPE